MPGKTHHTRSTGETDMGEGKEREFETGMDEVFKFISEMVAANMKRTYDEYQDIALASARRSQSNYDSIMAQSLRHMEELHQDARRHGDLAHDRQWNIDEQGYTAQKIIAAMQDPAIIAAMAAAVAKAMTDMVSD